MTDDDRRAIAEKWDNLPPNDEWWVVYNSFWQLKNEHALHADPSILSLIKRICLRAEQDGDMSMFDLLVQRVRENKLLGVIE